MENKTSKYFKYAIGEIALVVIGILIAVQINDLNELRKQKLVEINVLEGIKNDILKDTIDLNFNIRAYTRYIKSDSLVLNHLIKKKELNQNVINTLIKSMEADWFIILHDSHFQEAKLKGLSIISDLDLRESISRLYEFDYKALILMENSSENFNHSKYVNTKLNQYLGFDATGFIINKASYDKLLSNENIRYNIKQGQLKKKELLELHKYTLASGLKIIERINDKLSKK